MLAMEENVSKYTNAIGSGKQAITQGQKRKGGRGMREGWEYKKLGEVASSELGKTLNKSKDTGKLYPYICAVNVLWDMIDLTILKHAFFEKEEIDRYAVRKGDLLVCEGGDTGRSAIWEKEEPVLYQNAIHRVRFTTEMEARFAMYCLWHLKNNGQIDQKYSKGVTIKHLVKSSLLSIELPVPPLSTQHTILSELDKINELIHLKKEQLKDYDNLAQSIFYAMFGDPVANDKKWDIESLGKVCDVRDGTHDSPQYLQESPYILITSKNLVNGKIDYSNVNYISEEDYIAINKRSQVDDGDIIMAMIGTIGNPIIVKLEEHKFCIKNVALIKFFNDSLVSNKYVHSLLNNESYLTFIKSQNKGGTQKFVALGTIRKLPIPIPPLSHQQQFAQRIELIEKQKAEVQRTISDLETLLASRMQYWFD